MGLRQDPAFSTASCFSKAVLDFKACINYRLYIPTVSLLDSMLAKKKKKNPGHLFYKLFDIYSDTVSSICSRWSQPGLYSMTEKRGENGLR